MTVGTAELWPYMILLQAIPALISLAITPFMPDTPRYLMLVRHKQDAAQKGRRNLSHCCCAENTDFLNYADLFEDKCKNCSLSTTYNGELTHRKQQK